MSIQVNQLNQYWTDIYFYLHYPHVDKITHQAVRILQLIDKQPNTGINEVAMVLQISHNTASEHVKRLIDKKYIIKEKSGEDHRRVILRLTELGSNVLYRNTSLDDEKLKKIVEQLSKEEQIIIEKAFKTLSEVAKKCTL
ncbi:winged helix-turn-helix transcriptional regulator [Psychrobacillus sp. Sa2BUA9]|uniref:Winged helix-turn-helix transcriptional regulator n=1 Tax=Psychrobacillus faecigallinarum TaxID=2762235 RepID=A0ABR8R8P4_9BACI|nr:MarR family winged helix-turn-helix transcriptional regulator [Psychrobacillus faecigallinarum]MBD7944106.1 winged helix-turn-helix transcriptional regulator [Psychrobacillus faecigallinarum]